MIRLTAAFLMGWGYGMVVLFLARFASTKWHPDGGTEDTDVQ